MFVVIFKAVTGALDQEYFDAAERLGNLAVKEYGCLNYESATEGMNEIVGIKVEHGS